MRKVLHSVIVAAILLLSPQARATTYIVSAGGTSFSPSYLSMSLGDTVKWVIISGTHNTLSTAVPVGALNWSSGSMSGSATFSYVPTVTGTYYYECSFHTGMTGTNIVGSGPCNGPSSVAVTSSAGSSACHNDPSMILSTVAQSGASYQWYAGSNAIAGANGSSYSVPTSAPGAYSYKVKVSRCNIDSFSAPFAVTINPMPVPSFTVSGTGGTRTFTNTTQGTGLSYSWDFGDGTPPSTTASPTHTYTTPGPKTVKLKATAATGCNQLTQQTIQIALGVATIGGHEAFTIMPNPASDFITIHASDVLPTLVLTDFAGHTVITPVSTRGNDQYIDVKGLPAGFYLLRLTTPNGSAVEKITVTH